MDALPILSELLDDTFVFNLILKSPPQSLTEVQSKRLAQLAARLCLDEHNSNARQQGDDISDERLRRYTRRKLIEPVSRNPWNRFLRLEELKLPSSVVQHIQKVGTNAPAFLDDRRILEFGGSDGSWEKDRNITDNFFFCYEYTLKLETRASSDNIRWVFQMLFFFDLVKYIRPSGSGRAGSLILEDVQNLLQALQVNLPDSDDKITDSAQVTLRKLLDWSNQGKKLDLLCQEFGMGCLFYLAHLLSPDFLRNKFTASGTFYKQAVKHLRELGLVQKVRGSQEDALATEVRAFLMLNVSSPDALES